MLAAFLIGILGSFHCVGMCGPIALAMPSTGRSTRQRVTSGILYNSGRVVTYAIFGAAFGALGQGLVLGGFQQTLSIVIGSLMILGVLLPYVLKRTLVPTSSWFGLVAKLKAGMGKLLRFKSHGGIFALGLLNGLLPCGLVYMAIGGAIATGDWMNGMLFMAIFGVGTIPAMFTLYIAGQSISLQWRNRIKKAVPVLVVMIGVLFILRGADLGIPYVSPTMAKDAPTAEGCCVKP